MCSGHFPKNQTIGTECAFTMEPAEKLKLFNEYSSEAEKWSCEELQAKLNDLGFDCIVDQYGFNAKVETYAELRIMQKIDNISGPIPMDLEGCIIAFMMEPAEKLKLFDEYSSEAEKWSCEELQAKLNDLGFDCIVDQYGFNAKVETYAELRIMQKIDNISGPIPMDLEGCIIGPGKPWWKSTVEKKSGSFLDYYKKQLEMFPEMEPIPDGYVEKKDEPIQMPEVTEEDYKFWREED
uniref:Uncharacterized protein n=1 Tax=Ditylenchus dipsaci TaxID=166011 RepID=A0A915DPQ0_9BILA